jgi:hypothetical protein
MTANSNPPEPSRIRLVFQLDRAELPRLYDELVRFRKGVKRVNRLRLLAYEGLLVQNGVLTFPVQSFPQLGDSKDCGDDADSVTNGLFEPAIDHARGE